MADGRSGAGPHPVSRSPVGHAWLKPAVIGIGYCLGYLVLEWVSSIHAWSALEFTLWNPAPALTLALVMLFGPVYAPLAFVAALLAAYVGGNASEAGIALGSAAILAGSYGALGAVLRRATRKGWWVAEPRILVKLLLGAAGGALVVSLALAALHTQYSGIISVEFLRKVGILWLGDTTGIFALLPVLLLLGTNAGRWLTELSESHVDLALFLLGLVVAEAIVFFVDFADELRFFYLMFIPVIWLALRRGIFGSTLAVLLTEIGMVIAVLLRGYPTETFLAFQMLMLILGATGLLMGGAVTAWNRAQQQIRRQQQEIDRAARVTAIGTMGSALAHEISQPLASISTYARACQLLLEESPGVSPRLPQTLDKIVDESERAGTVLRNMREAVAESRGEREAIDLRALLDRVADLVRAEPITSTVTVTVGVGSLPPVLGNRVHLEQVFLNVLRNAIEATSQAKRGSKVKVTAARDGDQVEVAIDDEGYGIDRQTAGRLFEPFVTTKAHGLGLGLAISRNLMEVGGGSIAFRNLPGGGARFVVRVPLYEPEHDGK